MNPPVLLHPARVLLGVDGSEHSLAAVDLLKDLTCLPSSSIRVVSAWSGRSPLEKVHLEMALQQACERLTGVCAEVTSEMLRGHPAEMIVQAAERLQPDLVVVGAKGLRSTFGILLGGVAQQVVEHARSAVLVVRAPYRGLKQVALVTDGSETGWRASEYLSQFALPGGAKVRVCHVAPPAGLPQFTSGGWLVGHDLTPLLGDREIMELEKLHQEDLQAGRELLAKTVKFLAAAGIQAESDMLEGDAATEILRYAKMAEADLLVAGSRGLSQVRGWLMGSVSRKLVNFAGCSVLIVRETKEGLGVS